MALAMLGEVDKGQNQGEAKRGGEADAGGTTRADAQNRRVAPGDVDEAAVGLYESGRVGLEREHAPGAVGEGIV